MEARGQDVSGLTASARLRDYRDIFGITAYPADSVGQLTFLLFLKMADEHSRPPFNKKSPIPEKYSWPQLLKRDLDELEINYRHTLEELGKEPGLIGVIFRKAQNKIQDPATLRRLIADLIDKEMVVAARRRRERRHLRRSRTRCSRVTDGSTGAPY